jgi:hypothetical protein
MTNKYTWSIIALDIVPALDGETNVVSNIHWVLNGTDGVNTASVYGAQSLTFDSKSPFTAYKDLKRIQVQNWLEEALGQSQLAALEANLDAQLESLANPVVILSNQIGLPWVAHEASQVPLDVPAV